MDDVDRKPIDKMLASFRCLLSVLVLIVPWYYGSVDWTSQYVYLFIAVPICLICFGGLIYQHFRQREEVVDRSEMVMTAPPWPSVIFLMIAGWAVVQSIPHYSVSGGQDGPNSIQMQRLFLGESVPDVESKLGLKATASGNDFLTAEGKKTLLAWSVEPLNTKAAIGMIALVSALIWLGRVYFSSETGMPWLLTLTTVVGVAVALFGIASLLSWNSTNILGLRKGYSFGPFISRNIGGCFLDICLSAALGLTVWAFDNKKRKRVDHRYSSMRSTFFEKVLGKIESSFGQLTTFQIACVISTSIIFVAVISTASRGGSMGALVAVLAVFIVSMGSGASFGRILVAASFLVVGATFLFWFELDDRLRSRLDQSIWDEDFESSRRLVWAIAAQASRFYFWTGGGLGTFHFSHLPFQSATSPAWFYHAESLYWDALVDLGWVGLVAILGILGTFIAILWPPSLRYRDDRPIKKLGAARITALALFLSVGLHSFFDFSLVVPACFVPAALLLGATYGGTKWEDESQRRNSRSMRGGLQQRISSRASREKAAEGTASKSVVERNAEDDDSRRDHRSLREINASASLMRGSVIRKVVMAGSLLALMCYSLPSLDLMARADRMRLWNARQSRVPVDQRAANTSILTAGIWGGSTHGLDQSADGMRTLAYSILNEFQRTRAEELKSTLKLPEKEANALSSPTITHIALSKIKDNPTQIDELFIAPNQKARWNKMQDLFRKAVVRSPLDWRISYGIYLLDYNLADDQMDALAERLRHITMHRSTVQLQVAAIEHSLGRNDSALELLGSTLKGNQIMDVRVAKLLMEWYPDAEMPTDIFPTDAASLLRVSDTINKANFPSSYGKILDRAHVAAESLPRLDPKRSLYLAKIAKEQGDSKGALEYYKEAARRTSNPKLKQEMIASAIEAGEFEYAKEEIENLKYNDSKNPAIKRLEQLLQKAKSESEQ